MDKPRGMNAHANPTRGVAQAPRPSGLDLTTSESSTGQLEETDRQNDVLIYTLSWMGR
jgi:hypothetical protein